MGFNVEAVAGWMLMAAMVLVVVLGFDIAAEEDEQK